MGEAGWVQFNIIAFVPGSHDQAQLRNQSLKGTNGDLPIPTMVLEDCSTSRPRDFPRLLVSPSVPGMEAWVFGAKLLLNQTNQRINFQLMVVNRSKPWLPIAS